MKKKLNKLDFVFITLRNYKTVRNMENMTLNKFNKLGGRIIVKIITIIKTKIIIKLTKIKH